MNIFELNRLPADLLERAGGKARGLALLAKNGFPIAKGFVICELHTEEDYSAAADHYEKIGSPEVAVRSSATTEDGADFSGAGQYSTVLNVKGRGEFIAALKTCMNSLMNETATSYSKFFGQAKNREMNIVVQEMVDASTAGVCFTINPSTGENSVLLEAVAGLGESLVSGHAAAENHTFPYARDENGSFTFEITPVGSDSILSDQDARTIALQALIASDAFGYPLDLEWAKDRNGHLFWLQARPITTERVIGIDELDYRNPPENSVFTTCNIGEMLPGAITPLSLSTSVRGIDMGLRRMLVKAGAYHSTREVPVCIPHFSNHLFFNLTAIYKMAYTILGADQAHVESSICGKVLEDIPPAPFRKRNIVIRTFNSIKYFSFLFSRKKAMRKLDRMAGTLTIPESADMEVYYRNIDAKQSELINSTWYHYVTSSHSGAMSSTLLTIVRKEGSRSDGEARSLIAGLLENIDEIESVDILRSMRRLAQAVADKYPDADTMTPAILEACIQNSGGEIREACDYFIGRHGHRGIREAEMRSHSWKDDTESFFENILTIIRSGSFSAKEQPFRLDEYKKEFFAGKKGMAKSGLNFILNQARTGVYSREYTKARYIRVVDIFKQAYRKLAVMLADAGAIPDTDLIYFLTHEELGELIIGKKPGLVKTALKRRRIFPQQEQVVFRDVYVGKPEPVKAETLTGEKGMILRGAPISRGEATGRARIVKSVDDARKLEPDEIMVAAFTDIGWSPYYSVIAGLVTEVGSALSHGAVVAREYGLPLVVNVTNATSTIHTGDLIRLDATNGQVIIVETCETPAMNSDTPEYPDTDKTTPRSVNTAEQLQQAV